MNMAWTLRFLFESYPMMNFLLAPLPTNYKVGKRPDRTRCIHFQIDSFTQAETLHPKLSNFLNVKGSRGYSFQCSFVSKAINRVTFDLLDRVSIDNLLRYPVTVMRFNVGINNGLGPENVLYAEDSHL